MASDPKTVLAWEMFVEEMKDIEVGEPFALQVLTEAKRKCDDAGITVDALISFAEGKASGA